MKILLRIVFYLWVCTLTGAVLSCKDKPAEVYDNEMCTPLDSLFSTIFTDPSEPGAVVMICHGDTILYNRSFGMADLGRDTELTDSTVFNIASASKTFATAAIIKLRDSGRLSLDDNLSKFFPEFPEHVFSRVTLRHVLSHTSGLPDKRPRTADQWNEYIKTNQSPFGYGPDYLLYGREEELTSFFKTVDSLISEPGSRYEYQNAPYLLIPTIVERVTGKSYEAWMKQNIFKPAGLQETDYYDPAKPHRLMAHAYAPANRDNTDGRFRSKDGRWVEQDYGETEFFLTRADQGVCTSPKEFSKWIQALYKGQIISRKSLDEVNRPVVDTDVDSIQYGLGLFVQDITSKPYKVFHNRNNGGFSIFEAAFPSQHLYYLIFSNRSDWDRYHTAKAMDSILMSHKWLTNNHHITK